MPVSYQLALRLALYWGTIVAGYWGLAYIYGTGPLKGSIWYSQKLAPQFVAGLRHPISGFDASLLICLVAPTIILSSLCMLFLTNTPLPTWRTSWINKAFATVRHFKPTSNAAGSETIKKNQFGLGETNFNYLSIFAILVPVVFQFVMYTFDTINQSTKQLDAAAKFYYVADFTGYSGALALAFFLIPVTRHSVLIAAMGWSPLQALRMHVWAGYISFFFEMAHSILYVVNWFVYETAPVRDQVWPKQRCWSWTWKPDLSGRYNPANPDWACVGAWTNLTGVVATLFFIVLVVTSLNWFRRHFYRTFYISHVVFGTAMILMSIAHKSWLANLWLPSIAYYLASTTPTLVQALASRFRGGVRIVKVVPLADTGGCMEVRVAVNNESFAALQHESCHFVKLCVPKISLLWHPFSVYKHPRDPNTARFLVRPVGPFTKQLVELLTSPTRPITILDGFYRKGDRALDALQHDHVTIVTGGVAVCAFLTMIPNLLAKLLAPPSSESPPITKKIELHWVCRESPLIQFIQDSYFKEMLGMARQVASTRELEFAVIVHYTGTGKQVLTELNDSTDRDSDGDEEHCHKEASLDSDTGKPTVGQDEEIPKAICSKGFEMEPARLMAGRYAEIWRNLPPFVGVSFGLWISLWIIFHWYNKRAYKVNRTISGIWGPLIAILVSTAFSLLLEAAVLLLHKSWPAPKSDSFDIEEYCCNDDGVEHWDTNISSVQVDFRRGRPSTNELLAGANLASAPGIFMCGPAAMMEAVKKAAGRENSLLGLTRLCIYDEPSEL